MLLWRGGALRFHGLLAFFTSPGTWATSLKILSLGSPAWDVVVSPFTDVFAGFRLRVLAVGAGELGFLDWGVPALAFLRGLPTAITKVDSKLRSLESPVCFRLGGRVRLGINMVSVKNCGLAVFTPMLAHHVVSVGQSAGSVTVKTCESAYMGRVKVSSIFWPLLRGPSPVPDELGRATVTSPPLPRARDWLLTKASVPSSSHPVRGRFWGCDVSWAVVPNSFLPAASSSQSPS